MSGQAAQPSQIGRRGLRIASTVAICCAILLLPAIATAAPSQSDTGGLPGLLAALLGHGDGHGRPGGPEAPSQPEGSAAPAFGGGPQAHSQGEASGGTQPGRWGPRGGGGHEGSWHGHEGGEQSGGQPGIPPETQSGPEEHGWHGEHGGGPWKPGESAGEEGAGSAGDRGHGGGRGGSQTEVSGPQPSFSKSAGEAAQSQTAVQSPAPQQAASASVSSGSPSSAPTSAIPAATDTTASATPSPKGATATQPASHSKRVRSHHRSGKARTRASRLISGKRHETGTSTSGLPAKAGVARSSGSHRPTTARRPARKARSGSASHLPPVVQTVTRIVSVVPLPLRILIAALAAAALAFAARSRIAAARAKRLEKQRSELLQDVGLLQAALLPGSPERLGPIGASTAYRPASGPAAGGDFYDLFALEDGRLAAIVGDISGHGRQALPHTALTRFTLRAYLEAGFSPREALQTAGAALARQLGDSFATVAVAIYQPRERILTYACAGHPPPLVLACAPFAPVRAAAAPPIGAGMQTGTRQTVLSLPGAAQVCLHTDGVTEARVGSQLYGTERLAHTLEQLGPQASASALLDRVARQTDAQPDDMAACLLAIAGGAEAPRVLSEELALPADQVGSARTEQFLLACGVVPAQVQEILLVAGRQAMHSGGAMLEVRPASGGEPARVSVQPDNVAPIHSVKVRREMAGAR
jgi:serine phosphatase RsbU (regulator of sigma subunit)